MHRRVDAVKDDEFHVKASCSYTIEVRAVYRLNHSTRSQYRQAFHTAPTASARVHLAGSLIPSSYGRRSDINALPAAAAAAAARGSSAFRTGYLSLIDGDRSHSSVVHVCSVDGEAATLRRRRRQFQRAVHARASMPDERRLDYTQSRRCDARAIARSF